MTLSAILGDEIEDPEEEHFLLFAASIPSSNLGFISSTSASLTVAIGTDDLTIHQSPGLLSSNAASGTTGAVLWKISPLVAEWLSGADNFLFKDGRVLGADGERHAGSPTTTVLELGCGIAGVIAMTLRRRVTRYIATDLDYVLKGLRRNLVENGVRAVEGEGGRKRAPRPGKKTAAGKGKTVASTLEGLVDTVELDWLESTPEMIRSRIGHDADVDIVLACDCIYNEALVEPFVQTCRDASTISSRAPLCVVAQQLRSDLVFEAWAKVFHREFQMWRVPDELLSEGLRSGSGYVIHIGVVRGTLKI